MTKQLEFAYATDAETKQLAQAAFMLSDEYAKVWRRQWIMVVTRWYALQNVLGPYDVSVSQVLGDDLAQRNERLVIEAKRLLFACEALNEGKAELIGVRDQRTGEITIGVIKAGVAPRNVQAFPFVAVLLVAGASAVVLLTDAYLDIRKFEAERELVDAFNRQRQLSIAQMAQDSGDPKQLEQAERIIKSIEQQAIMSQGTWLNKISSQVGQWFRGVADAATGAASAVVESVEQTGASLSGVAILVLLLFLTRDKRKGRA